MAYIAMARKWRPNSFQDMVGQEHIAKTIENAITGGRLHHAFLFTGTRGVGKTTSARILARTLNCTGGNPLHPCGECPSCKDIAGGNPMDVIEIDAASNTGVDNIRDLLEQTQYTPMIGKYKVFVIDEVHMLSKGAFNALLKTLEEPPPHVIFIFATTEVNKVPQTILSRVQRFDFKRLTSKQIISRLHYICEQEGIKTDPEALGILAEKADGSMRDALTFFDQAYAFTGNDMSAEAVHSVLGIPPNELFFSLLESIANHDIKGCFEVVDKACSIGVEFAPLLDGFAKFIRNRLYIRVGGITAEELNISDALYGKLQSCAANLSNGDLLRVAKILTDLQGSLRHSTNPRLLVESSLARMAWLDHLTDLRKALAAINDTSSATEQSKKKVTESPASSPTLNTPPQTSKDSLETIAPTPVPENAMEVSNASFAIDFDLNEGPTSKNDFAIEFGNQENDIFETGPRYTRYDICNAWPEIIRECFSQEVGFFATSLSGSSLDHGDFQANPFPLKVVYRAALAWGYEQMTKNKDYQNRLINILEDLLQTKVALQYTLIAPQPGEKLVESRPVSAWESDLENEPILGTLVEMFQTELISTRKLHRSNTATESCEDEPE